MGNLSWDPSTHEQAGHDPLHACNLSTVGGQREENGWVLLAASLDEKGGSAFRERPCLEGIRMRVKQGDT